MWLKENGVVKIVLYVFLMKQAIDNFKNFSGALQANWKVTEISMFNVMVGNERRDDRLTACSFFWRQVLVSAKSNLKWNCSHILEIKIGGV